jgi:chromosome segregation ATPase
VNISKKKESLETFKKEIDNAKYYAECYKEYQELTSLYSAIQTKKTDLDEMMSFKRLAFDLECTQLQTTVDSINESINYILEDIFEKPIKVTLQLHKKNKTNDKIKDNVNLNIQYDGIEYDTINKLSGGEKDRISFALTLALSRINGSPFLLLDEVTRSLNDSYRTLCLDAMRKFLGTGKTIVCINHEDVEGNYDSVITLK